MELCIGQEEISPFDDICKNNETDTQLPTERLSKCKRRKLLRRERAQLKKPKLLPRNSSEETPLFDLSQKKQELFYWYKNDTKSE